MNARTKKLLDRMDKTYKKALKISGPAERKLLVRSHLLIDQMLAAARERDDELYSKLAAEQNAVMDQLDDDLEELDEEEYEE